MYLNSKFGPFCLVTSGLIENSEDLAKNLLKKGISFSEMTEGKVNVTELVAKLINQGENIIAGIENVFDAIDGSSSLLLLNRDGIYAARDRWGYTPLAIGKHGNTWAVTAETSAFPNTKFEIVKYL